MPFPARAPRRSPRPGTPRHAAPGTPLAGTAVTAVGIPALVAAVVSAAAAPAGAATYTVRGGDTLSQIAERHATSVAALVRANGLPAHGNFVATGSTLRLPGGGEPVRRAVTRTVRGGDTLWEIAQRHRITVSALMRINGLRSSLIRPGQRLRVGSRAPRVGSAGSVGNTFAGRTYSDEVVSAAARNRRALAARGVPSRWRMRDIIAATAHEHGVDPALALAVSWQEAGWRQDRVSVANAIGAMQVIPATADWISAVVGRRLDPLDPHDNALIGVMALRIMRSRLGERDAVAGYYQGLRSVREGGWYPDTRRYVANVMALKARFG